MNRPGGIEISKAKVKSPRLMASLYALCNPFKLKSAGIQPPIFYLLTKNNFSLFGFSLIFNLKTQKYQYLFSIFRLRGFMPTKHIETELWQQIEAKTVETIIQTKVMIKETDILQEIIRKGLQYISTEELRQYALQKKGSK
jgi:possible filamentous phage ctx rstr-like repressor